MLAFFSAGFFMSRLLLFALLASFLLLGCIQPGGEARKETGEGRGIPSQTEAAEKEVQPFSAHSGLLEAQKAILWYRKDARLVSVQGTAESAGKSTQWIYVFDSPSASKGYVISVPGSEEIRDRPFSFKQELGDSWVDSTQAASGCNMDSGEFSLEVQDGTPVWTIISGQRVCTVDASSGLVIE